MPLQLASNGPVVFIDDDPTELLLARKFLARSQLTNEMIAFESGQAFLDHMDLVASGAAEMPAIALVDYRMAGMDGIEVLSRLRERPEFADVPVVAIFSNSDEPRDVQRALEAGAHGYLVKPGDGASYIEMLNALESGVESAIVAS